MTPPPPPPLEEVENQPSPTGDVVNKTHAANPNHLQNMFTENSKPYNREHKTSYSRILQASIGVDKKLEKDEEEDNYEQRCTTTELKPTKIIEGNPAVVFKLSDKVKYLKRMKHVLIGKFSHGRPPIGLIKEFFNGLKLKGEFNVSLYDTKHLFIECALMEDFSRLWMRLIWYVKGFPMRMFKWTPDFNPARESPLTPVWIQLEGLPLYLFEEESLLSIANSIGQPLRIDQNNTSRVDLGKANVCVALDVSQEVRNKVWIGFEEEETDKMVEGFWQEVKYDAFQPYCSDCCHLGHSNSLCKRRQDREDERTPFDKETSHGYVKQSEAETTSVKPKKINNTYRRRSMTQERKELEKLVHHFESTKAWVKNNFGHAVQESPTRMGMEETNTKGWVQKVFGNKGKNHKDIIPQNFKEVEFRREETDKAGRFSGVEVTNKFEVLAGSVLVEEVKDSGNNERSNTLLEEAGRILTLSSKCGGKYLQPIRYSEEMDEYGTQTYARSTPPSPKAKGAHKDMDWVLGRELGEKLEDYEGGKGIILNEGVTPSYG